MTPVPHDEVEAVLANMGFHVHVRMAGTGSAVWTDGAFYVTVPAPSVVTDNPLRLIAVQTQRPDEFYRELAMSGHVLASHPYR
jgi:hypothetical protein